LIIVLVACIAVASAATNVGEAEATVVEGAESIGEYFVGSGYDYKFKTSNDITKSEVADLGKNLVTGEYSYISPEDKLWKLLNLLSTLINFLILSKNIKVTYTAGAGIGFFPR
jgi:Insect cuticle protein